MTSTHIDRRVAQLETRVTDIEDTHGETLYTLTRHSTKSDLVQGQLVHGMNSLGRGVALMMARMGLPPLDFPVLTMPTEAEVDAALDENC